MKWNAHLLRTSLTILVPGIGLGLLLTVITLPDRWDRAVLVRMCGEFPILKQEDGSLWLRLNGVRAYRIENLDAAHCP